jgi:NADPH-dependent 7-cyano-7-deazaguanine reductase QueF-like protein
LQQQQEYVFEMQQQCFLQETERALTKKRFQLDAIEGPEEGAGIWTAHKETGAGDG